MQSHQIKPKTPKISSKRVGRGGKRGKTSGKGHKGQNARAGRAARPAIRDIIKKIPKLRGHGINRSRTINDSTVKPSVVNVAVISDNFKKGAIVSPQELVARGLVEKSGGQHPKVKVLGNGDIDFAVKVVGCSVSKSAQEKIEKAGGSIKTK